MIYFHSAAHVHDALPRGRGQFPAPKGSWPKTDARETTEEGEAGVNWGEGEEEPLQYLDWVRAQSPGEKGASEEGCEGKWCQRGSGGQME